MGIEVVRFEHQRWLWPPPDPTEGEEEAELVDDPAVLLFDPRMERGSREQIGDRFRHLQAGSREADLVIVRGSEPLLDRVENDSILATARGKRPTMVLCPAELGEEPTLQAVSWSNGNVAAPDAAVLREAEILCGLKTQEAIYRQAGVHYLMPNTHYHAEAFVRLGDSLNDQVDLVRLSDWLVPRIDEHTALLADNGSMLPLLATVALRANLIKGHVPQIATLDEYPPTPTAVADLVDRLPLSGGERLLCLISVSSSGRVARTLAGLEDRKTEAVILCETGAGDSGVEHFAKVPVESWEVGEEGRCGRCDEFHLLAVSPRSYELRTAIKFKPEGFDIGHAAECREFWEAVEEAGAASLHVEAALARGAPTAQRHLPVRIDVAALLEKSAHFRACCLTELAKIAEPGLILIPDHGATQVLAELAAEAFTGLDPGKILPCGIGSELPDLRSLLDGVGSVLILDDTLITGATLISLRLAIHEAAVSLDRAIDVSIFVGVSRPESADNERRVRRPVTRPGSGDGELMRCGLYCAQRLLLPSDCPWCQERDLLGRLREGLGGEPGKFASERERSLVGMPLDPPLLPLGGDAKGKIVGSFFGKLGPEAAFAAVSAHAQHLHVRIEEVRVNETVTVFDMPLLLQAFFDPAIVAGLLRTLPRRDLSDPTREYLVAGEIKTNASSYYPATLAELALAALQGKLPAEPVRAALAARGAEESWAAAYAALLADY